MNIVSAEPTTIDSITTDPDHPAYEGSEYGGMYNSYFTIIVHVTNPPPGGKLYYTTYEFDGETTIDDNGMASFPVNLRNDIAFYHKCSTRFFLYVYDSQQNLVSSAEKNIEIDHLVRTPIITWNPPVDISTRTPLSSILNAVATDCLGHSVPGTFVYTPAAGTVLSEGTHTLHVDFTPDDTATYSTASADVTINVWDPEPVPIDWSNPADITSGIPLSSKQLNAVAPVDGTFVYTPAAGTVLSEGTHTLHVDFTPDNTVDYNTASADVIINVFDPTAPPDTSVPEFPSIALPVVAVLGMIAIIGRRKE